MRWVNAVSRSEALWSSGSDGSLLEPQSLDDVNVASQSLWERVAPCYSSWSSSWLSPLSFYHHVQRGLPSSWGLTSFGEIAYPCVGHQLDHSPLWASSASWTCLLIHLWSSSLISGPFPSVEDQAPFLRVAHVLSGPSPPVVIPLFQNLRSLLPLWAMIAIEQWGSVSGLHLPLGASVASSSPLCI